MRRGMKVREMAVELLLFIFSRSVTIIIVTLLEKNKEGHIFDWMTAPARSWNS